MTWGQIPLTITPPAEIVGAHGLIVPAGGTNLCRDPHCTDTPAGALPSTRTDHGWTTAVSNGATGSFTRVAGGFGGDAYGYQIQNTAAPGTPKPILFLDQLVHGIPKDACVSIAAYVKDYVGDELNAVQAAGAWTDTPETEVAGGGWTRIKFSGLATGIDSTFGFQVNPGKTIIFSRPMFCLEAFVPDFVAGDEAESEWLVCAAPPLLWVESLYDATGTLTPGQTFYFCASSRDTNGDRSESSVNMGGVQDLDLWVAGTVQGGHNALKIHAVPDHNAVPYWHATYKPVRFFVLATASLGTTVAEYKDASGEDPSGTYDLTSDPEVITPRGIYSTFRGPGSWSAGTASFMAASACTALVANISRRTVAVPELVNDEVALTRTGHWWLGMRYEPQVIDDAEKTLLQFYNSANDQLKVAVKKERCAIRLGDGSGNWAAVGAAFPNLPALTPKAVTAGVRDVMVPPPPTWLTRALFDAYWLTKNGGDWYMDYTNDDASQQWLSWWESKPLSGLLYAYEAWGDTAYLDEFCRHADAILAQRDDARGVKVWDNLEMARRAQILEPGSGVTRKHWRVGDYQASRWYYGFDAGGQHVISIKTVYENADARRVWVTAGTNPNTFKLHVDNTDNDAVVEFDNLSIVRADANYYMKVVNDAANWGSTGNSCVAYEPVPDQSLTIADLPVPTAAAVPSAIHYHHDKTGDMFPVLVLMARFSWLCARDGLLTAYGVRAATYLQACKDALQVVLDLGNYHDAGDGSAYFTSTVKGSGGPTGVAVGNERQSNLASVMNYLSKATASAFSGVVDATERQAYADKAARVLNFWRRGCVDDPWSNGLKWRYGNGTYQTGFGFEGAADNDPATIGPDGVPDPESRPISTSTFFWYGSKSWDDFGGHAEFVYRNLFEIMETGLPAADIACEVTEDDVRRAVVNFLSLCLRYNTNPPEDDAAPLDREEVAKDVGGTEYSSTGKSKWSSTRLIMAVATLFADHSPGLLGVGASCLYRRTYVATPSDGSGNPLKETDYYPTVHVSGDISVVANLPLLAYAYERMAATSHVRCLEVSCWGDGYAFSRHVSLLAVRPAIQHTVHFGGRPEAGYEDRGYLSYVVLQQQGYYAIEGARYAADPVVYFDSAARRQVSDLWAPLVDDNLIWFGRAGITGGLPVFDTDKFTLRVGETDVAEIGASIAWDTLAFNRGEHGPGELSVEMYLDYSPHLALPAQLVDGAVVELYDGPHRVWPGKLREIGRNEADHTLSLVAKGRLDDAKRAEHFDCAFTICDYDFWETDQLDDVGGSKYNVDTDSRIRIRLEDGTKVGHGQGARAYLALPPWTSYKFGRLTTSWAVSNPNDDGLAANWEARFSTMQTPNGATVATPWTRGATGSGSLDETLATLARCLRLRFVNTSGAGTDTSLVDRQVLHTNVVAYVPWDDYTTDPVTTDVLDKARLDQAMCSIVGRLGLATAFEASPIGAAIDNLHFLESTTAADILDSIAALNDLPVVWRWEGDTFIVHERETTPSDRSRWYVAYVDPIGNDQAACPDAAVSVDNEDLADYVALYYPVKDDADWPDGTIMRVVRPAGTPAATDRVPRLDFPEQRNITTARATDYADQTLALIKQGAANGPIPIADTAIRTVDGVAVPVWWVQEDSFISLPDHLESAEAQPLPITGMEFAIVDGGPQVTIHTGGSELVYHLPPARHRQKRPRPLKLPKWVLKRLKKKGKANTSVHHKPHKKRV